jgi:hypothetical protein
MAAWPPSWRPASPAPSLRRHRMRRRPSQPARRPARCQLRRRTPRLPRTRPATCTA